MKLTGKLNIHGILLPLINFGDCIFKKISISLAQRSFVSIQISFECKYWVFMICVLRLKDGLGAFLISTCYCSS